MTTASSDDSTYRPSPAPFDDPDADMVLRTYDNVDFRVMKLVLKLASPVFRDMLALPQPSQLPVDGKSEDHVPVVTISESSTCLDRPLRFCYPVPNPDLETLSIQHFSELLEAARKYDIESAIIPAKRALRLMSEKSEVCAFSVYAMSCRFNFKEEARAAAVSCLKWPLPGPWISELDLISATNYYRLVEYHRNCSKAICAQTFYLDVQIPAHSCTCGVKHDSWHAFWKTWSLTDLREAMKSAPLDTSKLTFDRLATSMNKCIQCQSCQEALKRWDNLKQDIIFSMKQCIDKVDLTYSWD